MQHKIESLEKQNENESLKKDIIEEVKKLFKKQNEEKLANLRQANEDLKKKHENEIGHLKKEHEKEIGSLKKDIMEEVNGLYEKLEEHEKEIMELKEKVYAKTATNENLNHVHEAVINPSEFQHEYFMNTEITTYQGRTNGIE